MPGWSAFYGGLWHRAGCWEQHNGTDMNLHLLDMNFHNVDMNLNLIDVNVTIADVDLNITDVNVDIVDVKISRAYTDTTIIEMNLHITVVKLHIEAVRRPPLGVNSACQGVPFSPRYRCVFHGRVLQWIMNVLSATA